MNFIFHSSIEHRRPIQLIYLASSSGEITQRNIIVLKKSADYLIAKCLLKGGIRSFRLDQLLSAGCSASQKKSESANEPVHTCKLASRLQNGAFYTRHLQSLRKEHIPLFKQLNAFSQPFIKFSVLT